VTYAQFLSYASGPGVAVIVALVISILVEYVPPYGKLSPKPKRLVFAGLCLIVPVVAALLRAVGGYVPFTFDPLIWNALVSGAAALGVGTLAHTGKLPSADDKVLAADAMTAYIQQRTGG
jgi:hypothetical protein